MPRKPSISPELVELIPVFKAEVSDRSDEVDPSSSQDWFSLTLGWAIAKGLSPDDAHAFALHISHHTDLG
jgi:hypothetical protein